MTGLFREVRCGFIIFGDTPFADAGSFPNPLIVGVDDDALGGSAHTSLGSLYYQVPRWPLAFGNKKKAEQHLSAALRINPKGIDPNYFFGDYLFEQGRYDEAMRALETALSAPDRSDRPLADAGRRQEIRALMDKIRKKLAS